MILIPYKNEPGESALLKNNHFDVFDVKYKKYHEFIEINIKNKLLSIFSTLMKTGQALFSQGIS